MDVEEYISKVTKPTNTKIVLLAFTSLILIALHISSAICVLDFLNPNMQGVCSNYRTESNIKPVANILLTIYKISLSLTIIVLAGLFTILARVFIKMSKKIKNKSRKEELIGALVGILIGSIPIFTVLSWFNNTGFEIPLIILTLIAIIVNPAGSLLTATLTILFIDYINTPFRTLIMMPPIIIPAIIGAIYPHIPKKHRGMFWLINSIFGNIVFVIIMVSGLIMSSL